MRFVKVFFGSMSLGGRDLKEISVVKELGADVDAFAKPELDGSSYDLKEGEMHYITNRPLGEKAPVALNRILCLFTWAKAIRKLKPDVISGHDLPGLTSAWISTWFTPKKKRAKLVYDAHEFEIGRSYNRSKLAGRFVAKYERFMMKRCAMSIVVNNSIADEVTRIHKLKQRPVVIRNVPRYAKLDPSEIAATRSMMMERLNVPDDTFLLMYHGMISPVRGADLLLRAAAMTEHTAVVLLGNGTEQYLDTLRELCEQLGISDRVIHLPAVPRDELWKYTGAVDAGVIALPPVILNNVFSMPNKLFENVQSLTPLITSDFPEMASIVKGYDIGLTFDPLSIEQLAERINTLRTDRELYARFKHNLVKAKEDLCWEKEKTTLLKAYAEVFDGIKEQN